MNEVTRIHLGRQPFTISVEAHHALKAYLADIQKQVGDKSVVDEVELRMAELLSERGVSGDKVVLADDVDYLKQQLGSPADFSEDDEQPAEPTSAQSSKRLFRDTDNAMLAGVAAGLSNYFGLDAVILRIAFVLLTIFGGGTGILIYIVLWLVMPAATTSSEKLQMLGKPVTVDALKETLNRADLKGAAQRANGTLLPIINTILKVVLKIIGIGFIVTGLSVLFGLIATKTYMLLHNGQLFQENLFPVGREEQWLVILAMILMGLIAAFIVLTGVAIFRRKWPIRGWATAVLVGLFFVGLALSMALTADVAPKVRTRYETSMHTTAIANIQPFTKVATTGEVDVEYIASPTYAVNVRYYDHPDLSRIKVTVTDGVLHVDSTAFDASRHCNMLCLFPRYNMVVQVAAPNVEDFYLPKRTELFFPPYTQVQ